MTLGSKAAVVVGSINMDLVAGVRRIPLAGETVLGANFQMHPGGKGANQAVAIARLGYPVHLIGRVGDDLFGEKMRHHLKHAGVATSGLLTTEGPSGVALIAVGETGENSIVVAPGANDRLTPEDLEGCAALIRSAGMVLAQLEIPLDTIQHLANMCRHVGVPFMLDPAPARELPPGLLGAVDWLTPNETEAAYYTQGRASDANPLAIARTLTRSGVRNVVLKLGGRGVFLHTEDTDGVFVEAFMVDAVDTTAAGDCFNGAFAVALLEGNTPAESARFAAAAAALSVMRPGAQSSMPSRGEVESFLQTVQHRAIHGRVLSHDRIIPTSAR